MKTFLSTLAIALALSFTAAPADAKLSGGQKCAMKANLLTGKLSLCLNKADANVSKGKAIDTAAADAKCEKKFRDGWDKTRDKAEEKDASLGADCDGAMSDAVRDSVEASSLIAAGTGRDLAAFAVSEDDLDDDSGIKSLVFDLTYEWTLDAYGDGCEAAGGSWESGTCTAGCETEINECDATPCQNGGVCTDGVNSFTCDCAGTGFTGTTCEEAEEASFNGCTKSTATDFTGTDPVVVQFDFSLGPWCGIVSAGTSFEFVSDFSVHPLLGGSIFASSNISPVTNHVDGKFTLNDAGIYPFFCGNHASMKGAIFVE